MNIRIVRIFTLHESILTSFTGGHPLDPSGLNSSAVPGRVFVLARSARAVKSNGRPLAPITQHWVAYP